MVSLQPQKPKGFFINDVFYNVQHSHMIRSAPRLTILMMVAITILGTGGLIAAFAQTAKEQQQQQEEEEEEEQVQDQQEQGDNPPNPT
jgi:flagellar basal body-associated protein FliL